MPKHIKALKCPQCGSTRATLIREDHYRCDSCSTEFFLDSDDITIHHKHETLPSRTDDPLALFRKQMTEHPKRSVAIIVGTLFAFFFIIFLGNYFSSRSMDRVAERIAKDTPAYGAAAHRERMSYDLKSLFAFTSASGRPVVMIYGTCHPMRSSWKEAKGFVLLVDGETNKLLKEIEIPDIKGRFDFSDVCQFEDGQVYLIINKKHLYHIDRSSFEIKELHGEDFPNHSQLHDGFARIEFAYRDEGDGFKIMTNLGKNYLFYPLAGKLYTEDSKRNAYTEKLPSPKVYTRFAFSTNNFEYEDQQIQLVRYRTLDQMGYPRFSPTFGWQKDYGGSGVFTERSPFRKVFVLPYHMQISRMQGYEDLTPGAYYFSPEVLYYSEDRVLISFLPTAAPDASRSIQCLDAQTGKLLWTLSDDEEGKEKLGRVQGVSRFAGGYLLAGYNTAWLISNAGKLVSSTNYGELIKG